MFNIVPEVIPLLDRYPDFFIIGAPKCGTTSLAAWLSSHPGIFMCSPKEPNHFSRDIATNRAAETSEQYLALFASAGCDSVLGEASTTYLRSQIAVQDILRVAPAAKFIIFLRNPVDMVFSVHAQLMKGGQENVSNFEAAWNLQEARARGQSIPIGTLEPSIFQYGEMCKLGAQVKRVLARVDRDRLLFIRSEELNADPRGEYLRALDFLGVSDVGWRAFKNKNLRRIPRSVSIARALKIIAELKRHMGWRKGSGLGVLLEQATTRSPEKQLPDISGNTLVMLDEYFREDTALLAKLTERNLGEMPFSDLQTP